MKILRAKAEHIMYAKQISLCIDESAKVRGTGGAAAAELKWSEL